MSAGLIYTAVHSYCCFRSVFHIHMHTDAPSAGNRELIVLQIIDCDRAIAD